MSPYKNDGTDTDFEVRAGDHHDAMHYFGLNRTGNDWDPSNSDRALLAINHEVCEDVGFVHPNGPTDYGPDNTNPRPTVEIDKEVAAHGVTIVEVEKRGNTYGLNLNSRFNRRITAATPMEIHGPASRHPLMVTAYSPAATAPEAPSTTAPMAIPPGAPISPARKTGPGTSIAARMTRCAATRR